MAAASQSPLPDTAAWDAAAAGVAASPPPSCAGLDRPASQGSHWVSGTELLAWRRQLLLGIGGERASLDWLLDVAAGLRWSELQSLHLSPARSVRLRLGLERLAEIWARHRRERIPLQYLVGRCPWRDLELQVAPGVLIPRQETELLVDLALRFRPDHAAPTWVDLGTGSGCLAVALARALGGSGFAVDASPDALRQAAGNLRQLGSAAALTLLEGDWWQPLRPWWGRLELVVANPPYIPSATVDSLDPVVRDHEPRLALDGGADGLAALRAIAADAPRALAPGGWLLLEHHHDQSPAVLALLADAGLVDGQAHRDLEGVLRFASARRRPEFCQP